MYLNCTKNNVLYIVLFYVVRTIGTLYNKFVLENAKKFKFYFLKVIFKFLPDLIRNLISTLK